MWISGREAVKLSGMTYPPTRMMDHRNWTAIGMPKQLARIAIKEKEKNKQQHLQNFLEIRTIKLLAGVLVVFVAGTCRYDPESIRSFDELLTIAARSRPTVMASWYAPTIDPRIHFGAVSLWYMGTDVTISRTFKGKISIFRHT